MKFSIRYGGKQGKSYRFKIADDLVAIRLEQGQSFQRVLRNSRSPREVASLRQIARFDEANVVVMKTPTGRNAAVQRDAARKSLKSSGVRFAGRVLFDPKSKRPVLYTENYFVRFRPDIRASKCMAILKEMKLQVKRTYEYLSLIHI